MTATMQTGIATKVVIDTIITMEGISVFSAIGKIDVQWNDEESNLANHERAAKTAIIAIERQFGLDDTCWQLYEFEQTARTPFQCQWVLDAGAVALVDERMCAALAEYPEW